MRKRWVITAEFAFLGLLCLFLGIILWDRTKPPPNSISIKVQLSGARDQAALLELEGGSHAYEITHDDGRRERLSPEEFSRRLYEDQKSRGWWSRILNVSSPLGFAWVAVGFLGQVLFTGRMIVQWLVSERHRRSVVPPVFWWMSLGGSTMLLVYFLWRKDPVGVVGQALGWFIYVKNLYLIYMPRHDGDGAEPGAAPPAAMPAVDGASKPGPS